MKNKLLKIFITLLSIFLISNTVYAEDNKDGLPTESGDDTPNIITVTTVASAGANNKQYYIGMYMDGGSINYHSTNKFLYKYEGDESTYPAYCIQGGASTPGLNYQYKLNDVDINSCTKIGSGSDLYGACGMAELLYQINDKNSNLYNDKDIGIDKYNTLHNTDYDFAIITTALRLWVHYYNYSDFYNNSDKYSNDFDYYFNNNSSSKLGYIGYSAGTKGNTYETKKTYVLNFENDVILKDLPKCGTYTNGFCYFSYSILDLTGQGYYNYNDEGAVELAKLAYSLFYYLYANRNENVSFKSNEFTSTSSGIYDETKKTYTMKVNNNQTDENKVYELLAKCADPEEGCSSIMTVKDQYGNEIGSCEKPSSNNICYNIEAPSTGKNNDSFSIEIKNVKKCNIDSEDKKVEITAKTNSTTTNAQSINKYWFGIYNDNSDNNYQALVAFNKDQINLSDPFPTTIVESLTFKFPFININCDTTPCDPDHHCPTLEPTTDIPKDSNDSDKLKYTCKASTTSDIGFEVKSIEDPSMSCIINNCEDTNEYEVPISANTDDICKLYCREEIKFYLPTKVYVNAGMQFAYDVGDSLKRYGIIKEQIDESKKLTSVVVRYKQCTAVFNQSAYNKSKSPQKEEYKNQCLFENDDIKNTILKTIDSNDIGLKVEYNEDIELNLEMKSDSESTVDSVTYCEGDCYEVENGTCSVNESHFSSTRPEIKDDSVIYSTMIIKTQSDYYLNTKFSYKPISGKTSISNGSDNELLIPENSYPVSINTETKLVGDPNISLIFDGIKNFDNFEYKCFYYVYNTIKNNNCENSSDLSQCSNKCFIVDDDGYSHLDPNCITWNTKSKVKFGLNYRNISLENMFPVTRDGRNNWYKYNIVSNPFAKSKDGMTISDAEPTITVEDLINTTESTGNDIYNDKHLEGKYVLTPETIKNIREYNKSKSNNYLSSINTYDGNRYKSTFFTEFFGSEGGN